jgi:hypothetical protein
MVHSSYPRMQPGLLRLLLFFLQFQNIYSGCQPELQNIRALLFPGFAWLGEEGGGGGGGGGITWLGLILNMLFCIIIAEHRAHLPPEWSLPLGLDGWLPQG